MSSQELNELLKEYEKASQIFEILGKRHAKECLLASLKLYSEGKEIRWKNIKELFPKVFKRRISDGAWRARALEFESLGIFQSEQMDPLKKKYSFTEFGLKLARAIVPFYSEVARIRSAYDK